MNIVIPAAGRGKRFTDVGYAVPKPFILIGDTNRTMLEMVIGNMMADYDFKSAEPIHFHIILQKIWFTDYKILLDKIKSDFRKNAMQLGITGSINFIEVDHVTQGPACSTLLADPYIIGTHEPVVILGCDQYVPEGIRPWIRYNRRRGAEGSLMTFAHNDSRWSYVASDPDHNVTLCREKEVISSFANTGIYYFNSWHTFKYYAQQMIDDDARVGNEFYIAPVYNYMIADRKKVVHYFVNEFYGTGTPDDLNKFVRKYYDDHDYSSWEF